MAGANGMSTKGGPMAPKGRAMPVGVVAAPVRAAGGAGSLNREDAAVVKMRAAAAKVNSAKTDAEVSAGRREMGAAIRSLRAARGASAGAAAPSAPRSQAAKAAPKPARRAGTPAAKKAAPRPHPARHASKPTAKPVYKKGGFEVTPNGRGGFALRHAESGMVLSDSLTKDYAKQLARHWSNPKSGGATFQKALKGDKKSMDWVAQWTAEGTRRSASKLKTVH